MKDRFINGLLTGLIAGIVINILNFTAYYLRWSDLRYLDWAGILVFGTKPVLLHEELFALVVQLAFSAFVGVFFAYFYFKFTSRYYLLKGSFFGVILWFFMYASGIALKLPHLTIISFSTAASNFLNAVVFGLVAAETLRRLDKTPLSDSQ